MNKKRFSTLILLLAIIGVAAFGSLGVYTTNLGLQAQKKALGPENALSVGTGGTVNTIDQFTSTTSPYGAAIPAITQRVYRKPLLLSGLNPGECVQISSNGLATTSGAACGSGSGGGGTFPFTVNSWGNSTTTTLGFLNGFLSTASSTISSDLRLSSLSQGFAYIGSGGKVNSVASSSINLSSLNNDSGFITDLSAFSTDNLAEGSVQYFTQERAQDAVGTILVDTATIDLDYNDLGGFIQANVLATSTLLSDLNTFTARQNFNGNASTTGLTVSGSTYLATTGGNVGIGTTTPTQKLTVAGNANFGTNGVFGITDNGSGNFVLGGAGTNTYIDSTTVRFRNPGGNTSFFVDNTTEKVGVGTTSPWGLLSVNANGLTSGAPQFVVGSSTATNFIVANNGNVGVGTSNPRGVLDINIGGSGIIYIGTAGSDNNVTNIDSIGQARFYQKNGSGVLTNFIQTAGSSYINGGNFGVGSTTPWGLLSVNANGLTSGAPQFVVGSSTATNFIVANNGNVGVGTVAPGAVLHTVVSDTSGIGLKITGKARNGSVDNDNGAVFAMGNNTTNNRQFVIADSVSGSGVRILNNSIDGYNLISDTRQNLSLGTDTTDVIITRNLGIGSTTPTGARLSVNSVAGDAFSLWVGSTTAPWLSVSNSGFGTTTLSGLTVAGSATSTSNVGFNISAGCYAIGGNCISGGAGGGLSSYDAWTHPAAGKSATTSEIQVTGGILSTASSTFSGDLRLSSLTQGYAGIGSGGRLYSIASSSVSQATTTWKSLVQAWVYPDVTGSEACKADEEFADGRRIHTLKVEYYTVNSSGDITLLPASTADYACNGYSSANATTTINNSTEQFITVSGNATAFAALMGDTGKQQTFINTVTALATSTTFTGVDIDIEGYGSWSQANTDKYYIFLDNLGKYLHMHGKKLAVDVPPIWNSAANTDSGTGDEWDSANSSGYYTLKYEAFNNIAVDYITIMAYDYHFDYGAGSSIAPLKWVDEIITFAQKKITDNDKIIIGIPAYGYYGATAGYSFTSQTYDQISLQTGFSGATRDSTSGEMKWTNGGNSYVYNDATSLEIKREAIEKRGIRRVSFWHLGGNQWFPSNKRVELGNLPAPVLSNWFAPFASTTQATTTMWTPLNVAIGTTTANTRVSATFTLKGTLTNILQIFTSAGTKIMEITDAGVTTILGTLDLSNATVKQKLYPAFSYATSTAWTGTTTIYLAPAYQAETWNGVKCETNTGTLNVSFYDGTNRMNMLNASTTVGTFTLSTNNSFTAGESRRVDIGTPASSPTRIACSIDKTIN